MQNYRAMKAIVFTLLDKACVFYVGGGTPPPAPTPSHALTLLICCSTKCRKNVIVTSVGFQNLALQPDHIPIASLLPIMSF